MRSLIVSLATLTLVLSVDAATVSGNARCGANGSGATCLNSQWGSCCSQYGWCGSTNAYCETGCQSAFGTCKGTTTLSARRTSSSTRVSTSTRSSLTSINPVLPSPTQYISKNSRCGAKFGGQTCYGSKYGDCCSQYSYCGSTDDYCRLSSCQAGYGRCNHASSSSRASTQSSIYTQHSSSVSSLVNSLTSLSSISSATTRLSESSADRSSSIATSLISVSSSAAMSASSLSSSFLTDVTSSQTSSLSTPSPTSLSSSVDLSTLSESTLSPTITLSSSSSPTPTPSLSSAETPIPSSSSELPTLSQSPSETTSPSSTPNPSPTPDETPTPTPSPTPQPTQVISNPGFESGVLFPWIQSGNKVDLVETGVRATNPRTGSFAVQVQGTTGTSNWAVLLSQSINVLPNQAYTLEVNLLSASVLGCSVSAVYDNNRVILTSAVTGGGYKTYTAPFNGLAVTQGTLMIRLLCSVSGPNTRGYFDDITLSPVL